MKFDAEAAAQISMSVIEAGTNAIQHGHKRDAHDQSSVAFLLTTTRWRSRVHDTGPGFDPGS